jgi:hypothetical protein
MILQAKIGTASVTARVKVCDWPDADQTLPTACNTGDGSVKTLSWKVTR